MLFARSVLVLGFFALRAAAQVSVTQNAQSVSISIDREPSSTFWYGPEITKPYLYPLRTAQGVNVLRSWPMEDRPGDPHDHIHHRGVWFAHADVNGVDFWNSDPSYHNPKMGRIVVSKIDRIASGAKSGTIDAQLSWLDPDGLELIHESRKMTFHSGSPRFTDFEITVIARRKVNFGDEKDGVFGMRVAAALQEPKGIMLGSSGCHMEAECWGKRGNWVDVSGVVEGRMTGIAVFDHPGNPRFPTYWHARGYGLLAANIFGVKAFTKDPEADGNLTLEPGESLHFHYRIVVHSGTAVAAGIALIYNNWAGSDRHRGLR